jgi:hypothetical protein
MKMVSDPVEHFRRERTVALLWFAFLGGPIAWALGLGLDYTLARLACTQQNLLPLHGVSLATLGLAVFAGAVSWREWRRSGAGVPDESGGVLSRSRFMATVGILGGAYFSLIILAQWSAKLFLEPCMAI